MSLTDISHVDTVTSSGLRVVVVPMPSVHSVVLDAHLRIGPRYESANQAGISHFLEHMLYRGSPSHPTAHEQALAFERLGGTLVAATYVDHGSMSIALPPESFDEALPLFGEVFQSPVFHGLEVEKGIVKEEILEDLDDRGKQVDGDNLIRSLVFGDHGLGRPITGTVEQLDGFDEQLLRDHHSRHYVAKATVLTVAGPVDPDRIVERLVKLFSGLEPGERAASVAPAPQDGPRWQYVRHTNSQTSLRLAFRAPGERDPNEPATELLMRTLDDGMSTRLYHRICDVRGLCYDVSADYEAYEDSGIVDLAADAAHEHASEVFDELLATVRELRDDGPSALELDKAKARFRWQLTELLDAPEEMTDFFALGALTQHARTPSERLAQLEAVTLDEVRTAAARLFDPQQMSAVAVGMLPKRARERLAERALGFR